MEKIKKRKKTIIIVTLILIIAVALAITALSAGGKRARLSAAAVKYTVLARTELVNSISVSGTVKSRNAENVYSTLTYPVEEIYVSVGDQVETGDILAKLDTASLELDIAQQRSALENSQKAALIDLQNKTLAYRNAKRLYENGLNSELNNAEANLKTAETDLQTKVKAYEDNKILFEAGYISEQELNQSKNNYMLAVTAHDKAESALEAAEIKVEQDIKTAEANLKSTEASYNNDSQLISLQKLEKNLADSLIKAPADGTVTAVYAVTGSPGSGLLFIIEDTENLIVTSYVKEYDAGQVHPGQKVIIRSDATGDAVLSGEVVKIAPTSTKNAAGATITSSTVDFETEIAVLDHNTGLKIGMNTRLNIILEKRTDVYAVPYDAVSVNDHGRSIVYVITEENGKYIIKEIVVETGMETDFYTEVSGEGLSDGVMVVNEAAELNPGDAVNIEREGSNGEAGPTARLSFLRAR